MKEISKLYTDGLPQHKSGGIFALDVDLRKMEGADAPDISVSVKSLENTDSGTSTSYTYDDVNIGPEP